MPRHYAGFADRAAAARSVDAPLTHPRASVVSRARMPQLVELFHLLVAANKTLHVEKNGKMKTHNVHTEILYGPGVWRGMGHAGHG